MKYLMVAGILCVLGVPLCAAQTGLDAWHAAGQTWMVWIDDRGLASAETYDVYSSTEPIDDLPFVRIVWGKNDESLSWDNQDGINNVPRAMDELSTIRRGHEEPLVGFAARSRLRARLPALRPDSSGCARRLHGCALPRGR
jgi:hypothetical protein